MNHEPIHRVFNSHSHNTFYSVVQQPYIKHRTFFIIKFLLENFFFRPILEGRIFLAVLDFCFFGSLTFSASLNNITFQFHAIMFTK